MYSRYRYPPNFRVAVLAVVTSLGLLWLVLAVFTPILQFLFLGPNPTEAQLEGLSQINTRVIICVVPGLVLCAPVLIWTGIELLVKRIRNGPVITSCPKCGAVESRGGLKFTREVHKGTEWKTLTCPRCQHSWHAKR